MTSGQLLCIGHRGAMGYEPENTLRSIRRALELGAPWIEIDVHSAAGRLMVIHDARLDRTTNGTGRVEEQTFEYLRSLDAGKGERIPTLEEVFDTVDRRAGVNVELKGKDTAAPVAAVLKDAVQSGWDPQLLLVSSFDHRELRRFKELMPEVPIGALLNGIPEDGAACGERLGAYSVNLSIDFVDRQFVEDAHQRGLKVFVYTVNFPDDIRWMRSLGVDGVFTNYPDRVLA